MIDDTITEHRIEDLNVKKDRDPDEPEYDGVNIKLNIDKKSYREQSITDDRNIANKNCDQKITKA